MVATDLVGDVKHMSEDRMQIMVPDISRAYFNTKNDESVDQTYVELPAEDPDRADGMCGLLRVHMYGTRAAADGWHKEYSPTLEPMGFVRGDASACVFRHIARKLVASVHGDVFTVCGPKQDAGRDAKEIRAHRERPPRAEHGRR